MMCLSLSSYKDLNNVFEVSWSYLTDIWVSAVYYKLNGMLLMLFKKIDSGIHANPFTNICLIT